MLTKEEKLDMVLNHFDKESDVEHAMCLLDDYERVFAKRQGDLAVRLCDLVSKEKIAAKELERPTFKPQQEVPAEPFGYVSQHNNGAWAFNPTFGGVYPDTVESITAVYKEKPAP